MKYLRRSYTSFSPSSCSPTSSASWIQLRSILFVVGSSSPASCSNLCSRDIVHIRSPWSRSKKRCPLSPRQWKRLFTPDGTLCNGVKFLKKVRSRGVDPSIRAEVWPFLLGVYGLSDSKEERQTIRARRRREYEKLRKRCQRTLNHLTESFHLKEIESSNRIGNSRNFVPDTDSPLSEDIISVQESISGDEAIADVGNSWQRNMNSTVPIYDTESLDSDSSEDTNASRSFHLPETQKQYETKDHSPPAGSKPCRTEDFSTWQRIIRLDAVRANPEQGGDSAAENAVLEARARRAAEAVGLRNCENLDPLETLHAARLVAILEAYALYDPEIGYCQGMSDLLSPIVTVMDEDHDAFWCFVGFMKKARHNFRLDEVGIRRQLGIVSKIIKCKDAHLYRHLEKLKAEDCFFVYRMVVVLFRRELSYDHTVRLWEVIWADQTAVRAGVGKSAWSRIRQRVPPTEDLLLYAIAASVLQRRKLIIEKYSSMDEMVRECNGMAGQLDVWRLLDHAHDLVVTLHDKIETTLNKDLR